MIPDVSKVIWLCPPVWKLFIAMFCFRTIPIDPRFYVTHHKINVLDVKWHPGSQADIHLMVLTSDNNLRYCEAGLTDMTICKESPIKSLYTLILVLDRYVTGNQGRGRV